MRWVLEDDLWIVYSNYFPVGYYSILSHTGEVLMPVGRFMHWVYPTGEHEANMFDITNILTELYPDREWHLDVAD
jgi:hypothetical protein